MRKEDGSEYEYTKYEREMRKKYGGLEVSDVRRLKQVEEENRRLKKLVADLTLDKQILQEGLRKKL